MTTANSQPTVYADADVPFKEIFGGKLGGHLGVKKYLESRQIQLSQHLADDALSEDDKQRLLLGMTAMREAINLVGLLKTKISLKNG